MQEDYQAILDADQCRQHGDRIGWFQNIKKGLSYNYRNYELYYMLGEFYLEENPYKAYLCFENAEYYCSNVEDYPIIIQARHHLIDQGIVVPPVSIVILSYNAKTEMDLCLTSLRGTTFEASREIIVIDNASSDGVTDYLKEQTDIRLICNSENVGFPAGCNQGIIASHPENDILLLNNDTVVTPNSIFWLRMGLYENTSIGATGSVSNHVSNYQQIPNVFQTPDEYMDYAVHHNIPMEDPYDHKLRLVGFAMLIKRTLLNEIGLLDERFSPGNCEDDDLSFRIIQSGRQLLLCKNSFIYHFGSRSFGKDMAKYATLLQTNALKFKEKWGFDIRYYCYERRNVASFISEDPNTPINVLEIGCGMGATLGYIKNTHPSANVYGIELTDSVVRLAQNYIPNIICGNIEKIDLPYAEHSFDYIIFADVLEHLIDPDAVLCKVNKYLKPSGHVLASIPNLMHYSVILDLLKGNFTYQGSGILDRTHMRFYTLNEIHRMFNACGYSITEMDASLFETPLSDNDARLFEALIQLPGIAPASDFHVYQYLISACPK